MKIVLRDLYKPENYCNNAVWEQQFDCTFLKFFVLPFLVLKVLNPPNSSLFLQKLSQRWLNSSNFVSHDQGISKWKLFKELYISLSIPVIMRFVNSDLIVHFWNFLFFFLFPWRFTIFQNLLFSSKIEPKRVEFFKFCITWSRN